MAQRSVVDAPGIGDEGAYAIVQVSGCGGGIARVSYGAHGGGVNPRASTGKHVEALVHDGGPPTLRIFTVNRLDTFARCEKY